MTDYYKILQIDRLADLTTIKKAYRKLAFLFHPDMNKSTTAASRFIEITEAYEVLSDPEKRNKYDCFYGNYPESFDGAIFEESVINENIRNWKFTGRKKASQYSQMDIDLFLMIVFNKVIFHGFHYARYGFFYFLIIISSLPLLYLLSFRNDDYLSDPKEYLFRMGGLIFTLIIGVMGATNTNDEYKRSLFDRES